MLWDNTIKILIIHKCCPTICYHKRSGPDEAFYCSVRYQIEYRIVHSLEKVPVHETLFFLSAAYIYIWIHSPSNTEINSKSFTTSQLVYLSIIILRNQTHSGTEFLSWTNIYSDTLCLSVNNLHSIFNVDDRDNELLLNPNSTASSIKISDDNAMIYFYNSSNSRFPISSACFRLINDVCEFK